MLPEGAETDTAFIDQYGDLESLIEMRREQDYLSRKNHLFKGARADDTLYTIAEDRNPKIITNGLMKRLGES